MLYVRQQILPFDEDHDAYHVEIPDGYALAGVQNFTIIQPGKQASAAVLIALLDQNVAIEEIEFDE